jgi:hypothetical protein
LWVDQTENLSGVFLHRSIRLDIFISDLIAQQRDLVENLCDENLNCIERPLRALHGGDMVLSCSSALILRREHELEITSATEPTGNVNKCIQIFECLFPSVTRNFVYNVFRIQCCPPQPTRNELVIFRIVPRNFI